MFKTGLNVARFREHVKIIEAETIDYFKRWGDSGERSKTPPALATRRLSHLCRF